MFELLKVCDDEEVQLMFMLNGYNIIELYIRFQDGPPSSNIDQPSTIPQPNYTASFDHNTPYEPDSYSPSQPMNHTLSKLNKLF